MAERTIYTLVGLVLLVAVELLRWLAGAPPELCTSLTAIAGVFMAGGPSLAKRDERGAVKLDALVLWGVIAVSVVLFAITCLGCGPRNLVLEADDPPPTFDVRRGPPCRMALVALGEEQAVVTHDTARCRLVVDGVEVP